jgi:HAD superfamily hydrolase (TIGR01490 family)
MLGGDFIPEPDVVSIALFDLDNTLIGGDSDYLWGCFLAERGIVDGAYYERENRRFYDQYKAGVLDIHEFLRFQLRPLAEHDMATLHELRRDYIAEKIEPILLPRARHLIENHRNRGHTPVIITATNRFITSPIAALYGVEQLLATEPEVIANRYTGNVLDVPCFREGKLDKLESWLQARGWNFEGSWFYSDSHNDLPLLSAVTHPIAVDPDEILRRHAETHGWKVISLRD